MPRKKTVQLQPPEQTHSPPRPVCWLKAAYHFHVFHYRMPKTAAIAAVTPFVPSPLTIQMAMVASLMQMGRYGLAEQLVPHLPGVEVRVIPPATAFSFKAFLRYRSVPSVESGGQIDEAGSLYPSRPHTREYGLFSEDLLVFIGLPDRSVEKSAELALRNVRYLGCKDSLVWCREVREASLDEVDRAPILKLLSQETAGAVVLLALLSPSAQIGGLKDIMPGQRDQSHYECRPSVLPGRIVTKGQTRLFRRGG